MTDPLEKPLAYVEVPPPLPAATPPNGLLMILFVWVPAAIFFTAIVTALTGFAFTAIGLIAGPMLSLFTAFSFYYVMLIARQRRGMTVLGYVETAVRLNLPLNEYLLAAQRSERGRTAQRLDALRFQLAGGTSVGAAIAGAVPEIPPRVTAAIIAAEPLGQLQVTLTRLSRKDAARRRNRVLTGCRSTAFIRWWWEHPSSCW